MQFFQAPHLLSIGQGDGFPLVASSVAVQEAGQRPPADLEQYVPQVAFDLVDRSAFVESQRELLQQLGDDLLRQFTLENAQMFCDAHGRASLQGLVSCKTNVSPGGPLDQSLNPRNLQPICRLRQSGPAVTPPRFDQDSS